MLPYLQEQSLDIVALHYSYYESEPDTNLWVILIKNNSGTHFISHNSSLKLINIKISMVRALVPLM